MTAAVNVADDRHHRLRRRQPDVGRQGSSRRRRRRPASSTAPRDIAGATAIVVPGVGHFARPRRSMPRWRRAIAHAHRAGMPLLGICLGLQWLFEGSDEAPDAAGLGVFDGPCFELCTAPTSKCRTSAGTRSDVADRRVALLDGLPKPRVRVLHALVRRAASARGRPVSRRRTACRSRRPSSATPCSASSFTRRNPAPTGLRVLANFLRICGEAR